MKTIGAIIALFVGVVFLLMGLILLVAAINAPSRLLPAVAMLVVGAGLVGFGIWLLVRQKQLSADTLDDSILELAKRSNGEVTVAQVVSELRVPDMAARQALDLLESRREAMREWREDRAVYLFPGLKESKVVRQCTFCRSTFSVAQPIHKCPHCGGTEIELVRQ